MSSSPTALTSTTGSSSSCSSRSGASRSRAAVIACGALGGHIREIAVRRGWALELHCLPSLLHNRPDRIAPAAEELALEYLKRGLRVAVGYADCGSYGALDALCDRLGLRRLHGLHCYDVLAGPDRLRAMFDAEPGTYLLTDFLVRSFRRSVLAELGLDRHPELWPDYFGHYTPGGLAGAVPGPAAGGRGGRDRRHVRPAAHRGRRGHRRAGTRA